MSNSITKKRFYEIVQEEIELFNRQRKNRQLTEDIDHASIATVTREADRLLKAVKAFEAKATDMMKNAVVDALPSLKIKLEDMAQTPGSYVPKQPRKIIKLRATKED